MKSHCLYLHPSQMPAPRVHNIGPARGSFCPYVHCSLHQHSHGTDTDTGVSRHCRVHILGQAQCQPKPRARSTGATVRSYARCIALSDSWALCAGCGSRKGQTPVTTQGEIFPMVWGNIKVMGCGEYTPPVIASREGPRLLLAARWWGITSSGVRIVSFLSSSGTSI